MHRLFGVVGEVVKDGDAGIACYLGGAGAYYLEDFEVVRGELVIGVGRVGAQEDGRVGVVG